MSDSFETSKDVTWLKELYFSRPSDRIVLQKGETLLREGNYNDRLFLILDGTLCGFLEDQNGEQLQVFKSRKNMFVGVYSFFSRDHVSYLTLIADEPTTVAFIGQDQKTRSEEKFATHFLPVIVHEIYLRQLLTQQLSRQRQAAIKKLYDNEKMATLGQLAAGLAHELNNAVGVLHRNTEWLIEAMSEYLKDKKLGDVFASALEHGLSYDTATLREKRKLLEQKFSLSTRVAKQLAKTNLNEKEITQLLKGNPTALETVNLVSEAAFVLHDMRVAANHSTHVVQSVKDLGFSNSGNLAMVSIYDTVTRALALVKSLLQSIHLDVRKGTDGMIYANSGDLVQIWLNLIKNACESLKSSETPDGKVTLELREARNGFEIVVTDNGPGISAELMQRIFEPNFTTKVKGLSFGLGLGLSIVKKIVANYKGTVSVTSEPGETSFTVYLPRTSDPNT